MLVGILFMGQAGWLLSPLGSLVACKIFANAKWIPISFSFTSSQLLSPLWIVKLF